MTRQDFERQSSLSWSVLVYSRCKKKSKRFSKRHGAQDMPSSFESGASVKVGDTEFHFCTTICSRCVLANKR